MTLNVMDNAKKKRLLATERGERIHRLVPMPTINSLCIGGSLTVQGKINGEDTQRISWICPLLPVQ